MNLLERLNRLEAFAEQIQRVARRRSPDASDEILALREAFNDECVATARDICLDPQVRQNHEVFAAMQGALEALRSRMVSHQLRWNADRIDADPAGYNEAAQGVQDMLREFVTNSRVLLRG